MPQRWEELTAEDHWVWDTLFARQQTLLHDRAVTAFQEGLDILHLSRPGVPNFDELSEKLQARTGWTVVAVPGLVPDDVFFDHLSKRRFPAGSFIRQAKQLDYLEEPDVFHDVFGHVPLLAQPAVADFMQALGELGLQSLEKGALHRLARLYWYTVEFGLAREGGALKIYGAGILSSSASPGKGAPSRSTAPASCRASASPIILWKVPNRTASASIWSACYAPATGPTPSSRAIS